MCLFKISYCVVSNPEQKGMYMYSFFDVFRLHACLSTRNSNLNLSQTSACVSLLVMSSCSPLECVFFTTIRKSTPLFRISASDTQIYFFPRTRKLTPSNLTHWIWPNPGISFVCRTHRNNFIVCRTHRNQKSKFMTFFRLLKQVISHFYNPSLLYTPAYE